MQFGIVHKVFGEIGGRHPAVDVIVAIVGKAHWVQKALPWQVRQFWN